MIFFAYSTRGGDDWANEILSYRVSSNMWLSRDAVIQTWKVILGNKKATLFQNSELVKENFLHSILINQIQMAICSKSCWYRCSQKTLVYWINTIFQNKTLKLLVYQTYTNRLYNMSKCHIKSSCLEVFHR